MQTNIPIQTVLLHKIRSISKPILRLAKETHCAPELLHTYHTILSQRPQLDQSICKVLYIFDFDELFLFSCCRYIRNSIRCKLFRRKSIFNNLIG
mgnify:CR=1 FL=1